MEDEFYHLTVKGNDLNTYVRRFQELATLYPTMVPDSEKMMEVFIGGLPQSIEGNVTASKTQTLEEAINIAQRLMDQGYNAHSRLHVERRALCKSVPISPPITNALGSVLHVEGKECSSKTECCPQLKYSTHYYRYFYDIEMDDRKLSMHKTPLFRVAIPDLVKPTFKIDLCGFNSGLHVDPAKIEAVKNWASPTNHGNNQLLRTFRLNTGDSQSLQHILDQKVLEHEDNVIVLEKLLADFDCEIATILESQML
ncbi:hypothetical protein Tco_0702524 [Tanacetum coccineum]|uniref:Reverse transcriptase domain-containing protein n=1 Tax=Tanacetum coccineum TaxID=301880 RepID=A0ABQ4XXT0_9ASTR